MKFNEFIEKVKNMGGIDADGAYGKQCMDLYNYFCNQVLNLHNCGADCVKNILNNKTILDNVERINNYPEFVPQRGDIAVWRGGQYGHVAICLGEGDVNKFKTIDQNWKPQTLTEEWHDYIYLAPLVFLRPKNQDNIVEEKEIYKTLEIMRVRDGVWGRQKNKAELTPDGQKYAMENGCYKANTEFTVLEKITAADGSIWARGYSGYICLQDNKQIYCIRI